MTINGVFIGLKEGFCGVCIEKKARSFVGEKLKKQDFRGRKIANYNT